MNKIFVLIFSFILMNNSVFSQTIEFFSAKEGVQKAKSTSGYANPVVIAVGSMKGTMSIPAIGNFPIEHNLKEGTSNVWLYLIADSSNPSVKSKIGIIKAKMLGFQGMNVADLDISMIPYDLNDIISVNWLDSKAILGFINSNEVFSSFQKSNGLIMNYIILDYLSEKDLSDFDFEKNYYWVTGFENTEGGDLICFSNAIDGMTECINFTSVEEDYNKNHFIVYPNPTADVIKFNIDNNLLNSKVYIINAKGLIGKIINLTSSDCEVDVSNLPSGSYYIIFSQNNSYSEFTIVR